VSRADMSKGTGEALVYSVMSLPPALSAQIHLCRSGCWEWQAGRNQLGYGHTFWGGRRSYAHRLVFTLLAGPIASGRVLDHLCRNKPCCNPAHLEMVTRAENNRRAAAAVQAGLTDPVAETPDYPGRRAERAAAASGLPASALIALPVSLARRIRVRAATGCWEWQGKQNQHGYGRVLWDGGVQQAHRIVWVILRGPIPAGLVLDHLCRVTRCVNPLHLDPVTPRENTLRGETVAAAFASRTHCECGGEFTVQMAAGRPVRVCPACKAATRRARWKERYATDQEYADRTRSRAREYQRRKRAREAALLS
jgi:hypothetical protein